MERHRGEAPVGVQHFASPNGLAKCALSLSDGNGTPFKRTCLPFFREQAPDRVSRIRPSRRAAFTSAARRACSASARAQRRDDETRPGTCERRSDESEINARRARADGGGSWRYLLVRPRPLRPVHPLGPVRPAGPARVGASTTSRSPTRTTTKYFQHFDPDLYDPKLLGRRPPPAPGMKYFVVTTKHHEGFCLWDSQAHRLQGPQHARPGATCCGRWSRPSAAEDLRVGFYHSLIDWHHPQYVIDPHIGPYRNHPDREKMNKGRDQRQVRRVPARPGARAAHPVRQDRHPLVRLQLPQARRHAARAATTGRARSCYKLVRKLQPQGHPRRPARPARRLGHQDARAVPAARLGDASTASRWCGRPARPSPAPGATTATRRPGRASSS